MRRRSVLADCCNVCCQSVSLALAAIALGPRPQCPCRPATVSFPVWVGVVVVPKGSYWYYWCFNGNHSEVPAGSFLLAHVQQEQQEQLQSLVGAHAVLGVSKLSSDRCASAAAFWVGTEGRRLGQDVLPRQHFQHHYLATSYRRWAGQWRHGYDGGHAVAAATAAARRRRRLLGLNAWGVRAWNGRVVVLASPWPVE